MLDLLPGTDLTAVRAALVEARRTITEVHNGAGTADRFNLYNIWAANALDALRYLLSPVDIDRLVTTRLYWSLFGKTPIEIGPALDGLVSKELRARDYALMAEIGLLDANWADWHKGLGVAVVPDTSVFVELGGTFPDREWHKMLDIRPHVPVFLVVTMAAVAELDGKKLSRDSSGHGKHVTAGVRAALHRIEELFPTNDSRRDFTHHEVITSTVTTVLLTDSITHVPLTSADAEMISRGVSILPYAGRCVLVSYDLNQTFRARTAGLEAHRLLYGFEEAEPAIS